jgi:hypothetical protein
MNPCFTGEKQRPGMSENRLLRIMFGARRDDRERSIIRVLQTEKL